MIKYHDEEWGVPLHDDKKLYEFLILEGAQAGLNWEIVLKKRENYRKAFSDFDPKKVARYTEKKVEKLLGNPGIIRNKMKIEAALKGDFDKYLPELQEHVKKFSEENFQKKILEYLSRFEKK